MRKSLVIVFLLLLVNSGYIWAFAFPTVFYMGNVLLHVMLGVLAAVGYAWLLVKDREFARRNLLASALAGGAALLGLYLVRYGAITENRKILFLHLLFGLAASGALAAYLWRWPVLRKPLVACIAALFLLPAGSRVYERLFPDPDARIRNPSVVPVSMAEEGGGPQSPFWPSSSKTNVGGIIPSNFFMESKRCGECHKDIYDQWDGSMHHFSSFNNQFYRKSIENMQDISGTKGSKWCAGCHDHAVFFNGRFDKPIKEQVDTPEAQNGLGCMSCHSIVKVDSTMGNGGFTIAYPPLHELASSNNPYLRAVDRFLTYLNPEPHRRSFIKPFMRQDSAEFCSTCHKVHLDVPVNNYRWTRGFNDYDNWQASGISGQGARSFYYPAKPMVCSDCHMPLVHSTDPGNHNGMVHSHRFPAANTAVAYVNKDQAQLRAEEEFLKSGFITVDLFAASPVEDSGKQLEMRRRTAEGPQLMSTFAVGEEAEQNGPVFLREVGKLAAPLDAPGVTFAPGSTVRIDAVVRTRKIGHFFPGGTVDAFDVWLELEARDAADRTIFWSGRVGDNGHGPVEKGAHFYRSYQLDADGNAIDKRNAFQTRSVLYVRLIPPGAADVAHYLVRIPKDAKGPIKLAGRLNYRKFSHFYTQFSYAGRPVPDPPIETLATASATLNLGPSTDWRPLVRKQDRERWNDWGIGLLLQGDLKAAEYAFKKVTEAEPEYPDGWLNVARALIQEGQTGAAKPYVDRALSINSNLGRTWFFKATIQKTDGDYDGALRSLEKVRALFPKDRVVLNQIGRILFLQRKYPEAIAALQGCLGVDPEDVQAHYNLMLCYRGAGDAARAKREEILFRRFKADESAQSITAKARLTSVEDNNERQPIHDHESVRLVP